MTKLLVYKKNGGKIYDLVMLQKEKERKEQQIEIQEELIRRLRLRKDTKTALMWICQLLMEDIKQDCIMH